MTASDRTFKCGACGTEARGFRSDMMLAAFHDEHWSKCPGFPPVAEPRLWTPEERVAVDLGVASTANLTTEAALRPLTPKCTCGVLTAKAADPDPLAAALSTEDNG